MSIILIIGIVIEVFAIVWGVIEIGGDDGFGLYCLIVAFFAAGVIKLGVLSTDYNKPFWLIAIICVALPVTAIVIAAASRSSSEKKNEQIRKREEEQAKKKLEEQRKKEIQSFIRIIKQGEKYKKFVDAYHSNLGRITHIRVDKGAVRLTISYSEPLFVRDTRQGKMVLNSSGRTQTLQFFGSQANERDWTLNEEAALVEIVDEIVERNKDKANMFRLGSSNPYGSVISNYERTAPKNVVEVKRPY